MSQTERQTLVTYWKQDAEVLTEQKNQGPALAPTAQNQLESINIRLSFQHDFVIIQGSYGSWCEIEGPCAREKPACRLVGQFPRTVAQCPSPGMCEQGLSSQAGATL